MSLRTLVYADGGIYINNTTDAVSSSNGGSFTTMGGMAIAKQLYVGTSVTGTTITGTTVSSTTFTGTGTTASTSPTTGSTTLLGGLGINNTANAIDSTNGGSFTTSGGMAIAKDIYIGGNFNLTGSFGLSGTTASTSPTTGILLLTGGIGINNTTDAIDSTNGGTFTTAGGLAVAKQLFVGTTLTATTLTGTTVTGTGTTASTSSTTGSVTLLGGIGINNTTDATSSTNGGSFSTAGGLAVAKQLFVGTTVTALTVTGTTITGTGATASTSSTTGSVRFAGGIGLALTTDATSATNGGTLTTAGGMAVAKQLFVGTTLTAVTVTGTTVTGTGTTASTSSTTGSVRFAGGIGLALTTDATSSTNGGTITTAGGVAIAKQLFVGTTLTALTVTGTTITGTGATASTSSTTGSVRFAGGIGLALTTDATDETNGGSFTTAGGLAVAKRIIAGSSVMATEVFKNKTVNLISSTTGVTITTAQLISSYIVRTSANAGQTDTFPTAALLVAAITNCQVGTTFDLTIINTSSNNVTMAAGTGGSFYSFSITLPAVNGYTRMSFIIRNTTSGTEAYDIIRIV